MEEGCRMGTSPDSSVVSVTIMVMAARCPDHLAKRRVDPARALPARST
jgi:hypothetical protein